MIDFTIYPQYASMKVSNTSVPSSSSRVTSASSFSEILNSKWNQSNTMEDIFNKAATTYQIPKSLLKAVAKAESDFNPNAVSSCGAQGIMQLMPATARSLGVTDSFDPEQNIMGGAKYLKQMLNHYDGDVKLALAAYNAGIGNVDKYGGVPDFKETRNYIDKVMKFSGDEINIPNSSVFSASSNPFITNQLLNYQDYTEEDYRLFINLLLQNIKDRPLPSEIFNL